MKWFLIVVNGIVVVLFVGFMAWELWDFYFATPDFAIEGLDDPTSIGVIGSSDGPTAIYVARSPAPIIVIITFLILLSFANAIMLYKLGKKREEN